MKKALFIAVAAVALAGGSYYLGVSRSSQSGDSAQAGGQQGGGRRGGGGGFPGGGGGGFPGGGGGGFRGGGGRGPMTVELAKAARTSLAQD